MEAPPEIVLSQLLDIFEKVLPEALLSLPAVSFSPDNSDRRKRLEPLR